MEDAVILLHDELPESDLLIELDNQHDHELLVDSNVTVE